MKYGHRRGRFTKANASRLGKLGAEARERKRLERIAAGIVESEPERIPEGEHLGVLTWHASDGSVRRWVIKQGPRANNIGVVALTATKDHALRVIGWDRLMRGLRKHLAMPKRRF